MFHVRVKPALVTIFVEPALEDMEEEKGVDITENNAEVVIMRCPV